MYLFKLVHPKANSFTEDATHFRKLCPFDDTDVSYNDMIKGETGKAETKMIMGLLLLGGARESHSKLRACDQRQKYPKLITNIPLDVLDSVLIHHDFVL